MLAPASYCNPIVGGTTRTAPRCHLASHQYIQQRFATGGSCTRLPSFQPPRRMRVCSSSTTGIASTPSPEVLNLWKEAQAVCFDVDSTLCEDESIDEIAAFLGVGEQVAALTASVKFQDALAARLNLMNPSKQQVDAFLAAHPPRLSKGIPELVAALMACNKAVFLVSGGFRVVINPIADLLCIPREHVFANTLLFKEDGSFDGFDADEFTSRSGGKAEAVRHIKARQPGGAEMFVGYGGSVMRANIAEQADWYVYDFESLITALPK